MFILTFRTHLYIKFIEENKTNVYSNIVDSVEHCFLVMAAPLSVILTSSFDSNSVGSFVHCIY